MLLALTEQDALLLREGSSDVLQAGLRMAVAGLYVAMAMRERETDLHRCPFPALPVWGWRHVTMTGAPSGAHVAHVSPAALTWWPREGRSCRLQRGRPRSVVLQHSTRVQHLIVHCILHVAEGCVSHTQSTLYSDSQADCVSSHVRSL